MGSTKTFFLFFSLLYISSLVSGAPFIISCKEKKNNNSSQKQKEAENICGFDIMKIIDEVKSGKYFEDKTENNLKNLSPITAENKNYATPSSELFSAQLIKFIIPEDIFLIYGNEITGVVFISSKNQKYPLEFETKDSNLYGAFELNKTPADKDFLNIKIFHNSTLIAEAELLFPSHEKNYLIEKENENKIIDISCELIDKWRFPDNNSNNIEDFKETLLNTAGNSQLLPASVRPKTSYAISITIEKQSDNFPDGSSYIIEISETLRFPSEKTKKYFFPANLSEVEINGFDGKRKYFLKVILYHQKYGVIAESQTFIVPKFLESIIKVETGPSATCAIDKTGNLWCWGKGNSLWIKLRDYKTSKKWKGVTFDDFWENYLQYYPDDQTYFLPSTFDLTVFNPDTDIFEEEHLIAEKLHTLDKYYENPILLPTKIMEKVIDVDIGGAPFFSSDKKEKFEDFQTIFCAVKEDKSLWCWGFIPLTFTDCYSFFEFRRSPFVIFDCLTLPNILSYGGCDIYTCSICAELNEIGCYSFFQPVEIMKDVEHVEVGVYQVCVLREDKSLWCWGNNIRGHLVGKRTCNKRKGKNVIIGSFNDKPVYISKPACDPEGEFINNWNDSLFVKTPVKVLDGVKKFDMFEIPRRMLDEENFEKDELLYKVLHFTYFFGSRICALKEDNSLWCWGLAHYLGYCSALPDPLTNPTKKMESVIDFDVGGTLICAISEKDESWCFGSWKDWYIDPQKKGKQLLKNFPHFLSTPVRLNEEILMLDLKKIEIGWSHACVLKKDGTLWCWGYNDFGQIGKRIREKNDETKLSNSANPNNSEYLCPIPIGTGFNNCDIRVERDFVSEPTLVMNDVCDISAGENYTCAIKKSGSVWCWGDNIFGQVGDGTAENLIEEPVRVVAGKE